MPTVVTPKTRLADLLEADAGLKEYLVGAVPAVRSPMVFGSVAKSATLEQIARVAGVSFRELIERLQLAGADLATHDGARDGVVAEARPACVEEELVRAEVDAGRRIASGIHPLGQVRSHTEKLRPGELVRLTSPFYPAPLIAVLRRGGLMT